MLHLKYYYYYLYFIKENEIMTELIKVNYDENNDRPTVSGRDLHEALEVNTKYADWFPRMCEYGFTEGDDYFSILRNRSDGLPGKPLTDHQLTIPMAKEICMLQRNEKSKHFRKYFISIEEQWNSPEAIMARALKIANHTIEKQKYLIETLDNENKILSSETLYWADRKLINAIVRRYSDKACDGNFALAWTNFKKELLYKYSINLNSRITKYLNDTGKKTKPQTLEMLDDSEVPDALRTIVSLCRESNVDIADLLNNHKDELKAGN